MVMWESNPLKPPKPPLGRKGTEIATISYRGTNIIKRYIHNKYKYKDKHNDTIYNIQDSKNKNKIRNNNNNNSITTLP